MPINSLEFTRAEVHALLTGGYVEVEISGHTIRFRADRSRVKRKLKALPPARGQHHAACSQCEWSRDYTRPGDAARALAQHTRQKHKRRTT